MTIDMGNTKRYFCIFPYIIFQSLEEFWTENKPLTGIAMIKLYSF